MGIHFLIYRVGNQILMVHDYVNLARWSKQNAFLDRNVRLLYRSRGRQCGLFPEVCTPQPGKACIETVKVNSWLENRGGWSLLCNAL
jgi:hypothetical protein